MLMLIRIRLQYQQLDEELIIFLLQESYNSKQTPSPKTSSPNDLAFSQQQ